MGLHMLSLFMGPQNICFIHCIYVPYFINKREIWVPGEHSMDSGIFRAESETVHGLSTLASLLS